MVDNYLLLRKSREAEELSKELGFDRTYFLDDDFILLEENEGNGFSKKVLLRKISSAKKKGKQVLVRVSREDILRFVLEKTAADMVLGAEGIHPHDSVHFLRSGLDQVLCKIAHDRRKIIAFSFSVILQAGNRGKLLARMKANVKLCRKYNVKILLSNFSRDLAEMRSVRELRAWGKVLGV